MYVTYQSKVCATTIYNIQTCLIFLGFVQSSFLCTKTDSFNSNNFLHLLKKCVEIHGTESCAMKKKQRGCSSSEQAVLRSCWFDKLYSFLDNADRCNAVWKSCNASQLEQNKAQANIREVEQHNVA